MASKNAQKKTATNKIIVVGINVGMYFGEKGSLKDKFGRVPSEFRRKIQFLPAVLERLGVARLGQAEFYSTVSRYIEVHESAKAATDKIKKEGYEIFEMNRADWDGMRNDLQQSKNDQSNFLLCNR